MPREKKPQISAETTPEFQARFDRFSSKQPASKREIIETALDHFMLEAAGKRLALSLDADMYRRFTALTKDHGLQKEWVMERALDQFIRARDGKLERRIVVDLPDVLMRRVAAFRAVRSNPEIAQLVRDALDAHIDRNIKYDDEIQDRFARALTDLTKREPN